MTRATRCNMARRGSKMLTPLNRRTGLAGTRMPIADFRHPAAVGAPSVGVGITSLAARSAAAPPTR
jgi:hypothetical protein